MIAQAYRTVIGVQGVPYGRPSTDLFGLAEVRSAKMVLAGDTGQLQAVENGGAMSLLADALGYVRLADRVQAPVGSAQVRSRTARVEMTDTQPHRPVHRVAVKVIARHPPHLAALITARRRAARRAGGQDDGELLPDFAVAGVEDHVLRVNVDADQPGDLALNTGLFFRLPDGRLHHRFTQVDGAAGHRPVLVVRTPDEQDIAGGIGHDHVDRRHKTAGRGRGGVVVEVDSASHMS